MGTVEKKCIVIPFYAHKGGVGKTTDIHNFGCMLAKTFNLKVLLVDGDPQCSLTGSVMHKKFRRKGRRWFRRVPDGVDQASYWAEKGEERFYQRAKRTRCRETFFKSIMKRGEDISTFTSTYESRERLDQIRLQTFREFENLKFLPGDIDLNIIEQDVARGFTTGENDVFWSKVPVAMSEWVRKIGDSNKVDVVLIDLNPGATAFNASIVMGSDYFIIPNLPDYYSRRSVGSVHKVLCLWDQSWKKLRNSQKQKITSAGPKFLGYTFNRVKFYDKTPTQDHQIKINKIKTEILKVFHLAEQDEIEEEPQDELQIEPQVEGQDESQDESPDESEDELQEESKEDEEIDEVDEDNGEILERFKAENFQVCAPALIKEGTRTFQKAAEVGDPVTFASHQNMQHPKANLRKGEAEEDAEAARGSFFFAILVIFRNLSNEHHSRLNNLFDPNYIHPFLIHDSQDLSTVLFGELDERQITFEIPRATKVKKEQVINSLKHFNDTQWMQKKNLLLEEIKTYSKNSFIDKLRREIVDLHRALQAINRVNLTNIFEFGLNSEDGDVMEYVKTVQGLKEREVKLIKKLKDDRSLDEYIQSLEGHTGSKIPIGPEVLKIYAKYNAKALIIWKFKEESETELEVSERAGDLKSDQVIHILLKDKVHFEYLEITNSMPLHKAPSTEEDPHPKKQLKSC